MFSRNIVNTEFLISGDIRSDLSVMAVVWTSPPQYYGSVYFSAGDDEGWTEHRKSQEWNAWDGFLPPHHPLVPSVAVLQDLMGICSLMSLYRALFKVLGSPRWSRHLCEHYKYLCVLKPWTLTSDQQPLSAVDAWQFSSFISHLMSVGTHFPVLHTHSSTATMAAAACTSDYKVYPPAENVRSAPRNKKTSSNSSSGSLCLSLSLC